ncbi:MAG: ABC transporter permease [Cyanobacteria bacterium]|nr:ABC transporter permease [Cyanobacteriota bacterium]
MSGARRFFQRLLSAIRHDRAEDDLAREVAAHLALLEEQFRSDGMTPEAARLAARRAFGGVEQAKEHQRDARSFRWIADLRQDITYGARSFARSPGFTIAAVLTLALGIGAATTIFGALYFIGLRPLPYADPDRIMRVFEYLPPRDGIGAPRRGHPFAPSQLDVVRKSASFSDIGLEIPRLMIMKAGDTPARVGGSRMSAAIFDLIDVQPIRGRGFQEPEEHKGADNVVVISHSLWQRQLGGRDDVIGATLTLDDRPHTIVGVMPAGFQFPPGSTGEIWTPLVPAATPPAFRLPFYARLHDGVSPAAAQQEIAAIYDAVRGTNASNRPRLEVLPAKDVLIEPFKPAITVLAVAVIVVLLIACVNVANLVLARSTVREYEVALRAALGASRSRIIRQHLAEGVLLALAAGFGGIAIAVAGTSWLSAFGSVGPRRDMLPGINIPRLSETAVDATVIGFALAVSVLAGLAFGLIAGVRRPATLASSLRRERPRWSWLGVRGMQQSLVIAEVAMAMVLFVGSALMIRSFMHLSSIDTGFTAEGLLSLQVTLPASRTPPEVTNFGEALIDRVASLPQVEAAAYAESLPMVPVGRPAPLSRTPVIPKPDPAAPLLDVRIVSHDFTTVMGMRILSGRPLAAADGAAASRAVLINETLARQMFEGAPVVGGMLFIGGPTFDPPGRSGPLQPWEIVGVIADVKQRNVIDAPAPQIFIDQRQVPGPTGVTAINLVIRSTGDTAGLLASLRPMVTQLEPQAFIDNVAPLNSLVANTYARPRLYALVLGLYSTIAIGLVAIGIYGVIAFAVAQRTREIGIRMALGARRYQVRALVVRDSALVTAAGLVIGLGGAAWSSRLFEGLLFGVAPLDRGTYAAVAVAFAAIALVAAFIPARRASAVDPVTALRAE